MFVYSKVWTILAFLLPLPLGVGAAERREKATFAGGCFWCMEQPFESIDGVEEVVAGYCGGDEENPVYEQVSSGRTAHLEAVQITFDPARVSYQMLLEVFWRQINPTDGGGQFVDRGKQYRTAIFYHSPAQQAAAEHSLAQLQASGRFDKPLVTLIRAAGPFYPAEDYHQDYYKQAAQRYHFYRLNSGRDQFLDQVWGGAPPFVKPDDEQLRRQLSALLSELSKRVLDRLCAGITGRGRTGSRFGAGCHPCRRLGAVCMFSGFWFRGKRRALVAGPQCRLARSAGSAGQ